jgi:Flp pilus assembly protein TadG
MPTLSTADGPQLKHSEGTYRHHRQHFARCVDPQAERGAVTIWVIFMATVMLLVGGLVIDGGYTISAKREAARVAEQAARVASDELDTDSLRTGGSDLEAAAARTSAAKYLAQAGATGQVTVDGDKVTVTVTARTKTVILSAFGVGGYTVKASATATSIDGQNPGP